MEQQRRSTLLVVVTTTTTNNSIIIESEQRRVHDRSMTQQASMAATILIVIVIVVCDWFVVLCCCYGFLPFIFRDSSRCRIGNDMTTFDDLLVTTILIGLRTLRAPTWSLSNVPSSGVETIQSRRCIGEFDNRGVVVLVGAARKFVPVFWYCRVRKGFLLILVVTTFDAIFWIRSGIGIGILGTSNRSCWFLVWRCCRGGGVVVGVAVSVAFFRWKPHAGQDGVCPVLLLAQQKRGSIAFFQIRQDDRQRL